MQCPAGLGNGMIGGGIYCLPASELPRRASLTASVRYHSAGGSVFRNVRPYEPLPHAQFDPYRQSVWYAGRPWDEAS